MHKKFVILNAFLVIFITFSYIVNVNASEVKNITLLPIKDTYADSTRPTQTMGNSDYLYFGNFSGIMTETFLSFEISSKYKNISVAEIQIQGIVFCSGNESYTSPLKANFSLTSNNWEESTLNWENKPSPQQEITSFWINSFSWSYSDPPVFFNVDIIDTIQFVSESENILSICISTIVEDPIYLGYLTIASKEAHDNNILFGPLLHLTYIEVPLDELPILLLVIETVAVLGVVIGLGYFYYVKRKNRQRYNQKKFSKQ
jgi:hypothetical protein